MYFQNGMCVKSDSYMLDAECVSERTVRWAKMVFMCVGLKQAVVCVSMCLNQRRCLLPTLRPLVTDGHI